MEDEKIEIGIKEIQKIKMSTEEKEQMLGNIFSFHVPAIKPVHSPFSFLLMFQRHHFAYYGILSFLVIVLSGGGVVFASQKSLPGNLLYSLKVSVIEPINYSFKSSPEDRAQYASNLATKRLIEAETLTYQGKLDASKEEQLNNLLTVHTANLDKAIAELNQNKSDEKARGIVTSFQAEMGAHAQILGIITKQTNTEEKQNKNIQISETARVSADTVRNSFESSNKKTIFGYEKNKDSIESIINSTTSSLSQIPTAVSPVKQQVIEDTQKTLDQSKQFLNEANEQSKIGDSKSAYSSILDSESSAKEASILLETGLKLEEINKK